MGKKEGQSGPPGRRRPQRERNPGRAGKKPPPIYRPTKKGGGTSHKPGTPTRNGGMCRAGRLIAAMILGCFAAALVGTALGALG